MRRMKDCSDRVMALCILWLKKVNGTPLTGRIAMSERIIHYGGGMSYWEGFPKIVAANKIHHLLCVFCQLLGWAIPFDSLVKKNKSKTSNLL